MAKPKYYKVSEKEMELIGTIINNLIENSKGCKNGEYSVDDSGFMMTPSEKTWGFVEGDDIVDAQENEEEVIDCLNFVINDCM